VEPITVVLYQHDSGTAQTLAASLSQQFASVYCTASTQELRPVIAKRRAEVAVVDLETSGSGEVDKLHREFPDLCIVGTHRLADDKLWAEAMTLGASDICEPRRDAVMQSVRQSISRRIAPSAA
jgi:DNA-binding NtrC family response regulator